jgi:hypothetical protein
VFDVLAGHVCFIARSLVHGGLCSVSNRDSLGWIWSWLMLEWFWFGDQSYIFFMLLYDFNCNFEMCFGLYHPSDWRS